MTTAPQKTYEYLLWDLDGTLTDPMIGITNSVRYALSYFGIEERNENLIPFIGPPLKDSFMEFYHFTEQQADLAIEKYRENFHKTGIFENRLYDGMSALLSRLKLRGKQMYIATSKPTVFAKIVAEHFDIAKYFIAICGSELDGSRVKKDEVIAYTLNLISNPDKSKILMIGDRMHDMIGAKANGIDSLGVLFGYGSKDELTKNGATYLVDNLEQLEAFLQ